MATPSTRPLVVTSIRETVGGCPMIWEGQIDDWRSFYIRFRWGWLTVLVNDEQIFAYGTGNSWRGVMDFDEMAQITEGVLDFSEVRR